jgi:hypothetical protein
MPLIGVVDPSHTGIRARKAGKLPEWYTLEELELKAAESGPKWSPWQYELINAALGEHQERGDRLSTTLLVSSCPRGQVIERKEDYIGDLDSMYASLRGVLLHAMLERYNRPWSIAEARFYTEVDGIEFSGSPDLLTQDTVYDYKMTENPPTFGYPYTGHKEQVMLNAFLARHATRWDHEGPLPFDPREHPVTQAVVVYIGPKWPKPIMVQRKETWVTPKGVEKEGNRPYIWTDSEVLEAFRPRLHMMAEALRMYPKWPKGAEELWGGEPGWECPGPPLCHLPMCLAKRKLFVWENPR